MQLRERSFFAVKYTYTKHYTRDEARGLLPQIRVWLAELNRLRDEVLERIGTP